ELQYEADRFAKLTSNIDPKDPDPQSLIGRDTHLDRMRLLMSNKCIPYVAQLLVVACERSPEKLDERMTALRLALGRTGCEVIEPALPTSTVAFFNCATPGIGPWIDYPDYRHKMNDAINVAHLWPASATPSASLADADWIADGDRNNLIGGRMFQGSTPDHMMCAASTGFGKSASCQVMMLQAAPELRLLVVIDNGLSWMTTCHKLDPKSRPIILRSNGGQSFNPLDTGGLPRASQHMASAVAICHLLVGQHADSDKDKLRAAILEETISEVYGIAYRKWRKNHPEEHYELCLEAAALLEYQKAEKIETFLDSFLEARALRKSDSSAFSRYERLVDEAGALALDHSPDTAPFVEALAFSKFSPAMFPTVSDLQDQLHSASLVKGPHAELCATLASLLRPWLRDGRHGVLLDGPSNIDLGSTELDDSIPIRVLHFELGELGEAEHELRSVAGFLIATEIFNHIKGMNRGIRKAVVVEEMVSFLKIPNAEQIIVDYWQTARKFSTIMLAVFQTYSTLLDASPKVAKAIVSNSSSMLLLGNRNRDDVDTLSSFLPKPGLPEVIRDQICRFPKPTELSAEQAYGGFVYARLSGSEPKFTVGRHYLSKEVEEITSSLGADFEKKRKELRASSIETERK